VEFTLESYIEDISVCDRLIDFFKNDRFSVINKVSGRVYKNGRSYKNREKKSTDLSIYASEHINSPVIDEYVNQLVPLAENYIDTYSFSNAYGSWGISEAINIQYYKPGEGFCSWHTERYGGDYPYNNRHLVFMTYLNDVYDGGGTEFYHQKYTTTARKGKTLIWPADWTFTHRGEVAPSEEKYIITGWFSFVPERFLGN